MAVAIQTTLMLVWPSEASYGTDLSDFHPRCTAAFADVSWRRPLRLSAYLHGLLRLLTALTFQTFLVFAQLPLDVFIACVQQPLLLSHGT